MSSTLTSADLALKRPSTRRHAPPGGMSSISFGDAPSLAAAVVASSTQESVPTPAKTAAPVPTSDVFYGRHRPGGQSSISFGDAHSSLPKQASVRPPAPTVVDEVVATVATPPAVNVVEGIF